MLFPSLPTGVIAGLTALLLPHVALAAGQYFVPEQESASSGVVADANGRLHAVHTGYDAPNKGKVYYRTCTSDCLAPTSWQTVVLPFEDPVSVQVATTPEGNPRLLVINTTSGNGVSRGFDYAACDADCLDAGNWTTTRIAAAAEGTLEGLFQYRIPARNFVIDGTGQPHFVFVDANYLVEPDHYGAFYMTCTTQCGDPTNWIETNLALQIPERYLTEQFGQPVLAATPDGKLRMLATAYPFDEEGNQLEYGLFYYACDTGCTDRSNWIRTRVIEPGFGSYPNPTWDLEVTEDGRPRAVLFAGDGMTEQHLSNQLIYMWCETDCGSDANWAGTIVGWAEGAGESPDLEINGRGQPRIAALSNHGDLAVISCEDRCETDAGQWNAAYVEETAAAAADRPTAIPFHCDGELWQGQMPRLTLNGDTPWFTYDLVVEARCLYKELGDPDPRPTAIFNEIWRGGRLATIE